MNRRFVDKVVVFLGLGVLSSSIPELLTGSTPVTRYVEPRVFLVLVLLYGIPSFLILEYSLWNKFRLSDVFLLGTITGVLVEGIAVNTYYNPSPSVMGDFSGYGRIAGVNFDWALYITLFHGVYSVTVPVVALLVIFRERLEGLRLSFVERTALVLVLSGVLYLFNVSGDVYSPPPVYHVFSLVGIICILAFHRVLQGKRLSGPLWPARFLVLYAPLLVPVVFYGGAKILPVSLHVLFGVFMFIALYNVLWRFHVLDIRGSWRVARDLLVGMIIVSAISLLANGYYLLSVPILVFSAFVVTVDSRIKRVSFKDDVIL